MVIHFQLGKLRLKPDSMTRQWDVYPKEGDNDYAEVNPQNFRPIFTDEQLTVSLRATFLQGPILRASIVMDIKALYKGTLSSYTFDPEATLGLELALDPKQPRWKIGTDNLLCLDDWIYVPDYSDLHLQVLRNFHDHIIAGHYGQNQTLDSV